MHFDQEPEDEKCESFVLQSWCRGHSLRAPAENRDDWIDAWSCAGLVNVLLRDVLSSDFRVCLRAEDESVLAVAGPRAVLQQLRADGVFSTDDEDDGDS